MACAAKGLREKNSSSPVANSRIDLHASFLYRSRSALSATSFKRNLDSMNDAFARAHCFGNSARLKNSKSVCGRAASHLEFATLARHCFCSTRDDKRLG